MKLERERAEKENWEQYLRCDSLPRPKVPAQIRTFLSKLRHFEDIEAINSVDWTLAVDERSVLTQNVFQKDLTRRVLENKIKNSPGPYFEVSIRNCLEVLRQVDVLMGNETEMEKLDADKQVDIMNVSAARMWDRGLIIKGSAHRSMGTSNWRSKAYLIGLLIGYWPCKRRICSKTIK